MASQRPDVDVAKRLTADAGTVVGPGAAVGFAPSPGDRRAAAAGAARTLRDWPFRACSVPVTVILAAFPLTAPGIGGQAVTSKPT
jgi:hypothetical protein